MVERELPVPGGANLENGATAIEECCAREGLKQKLRGGLAKYPGSTHWHYQRPGARGTLEITLWRGRIWISIQSGRTGDWIEEIASRLEHAIPRALIERR